MPWPGGDGKPIENWDCTYGKGGLNQLNLYKKWISGI